MPGGSITGVVGQIVWSYYTAATIERYTVTRSEEGQWRVSGTVVLADAFKLTQRPLYFVAPHAKGEWRWPITSIEIGPDKGPHQLRATLGPPDD